MNTCMGICMKFLITKKILKNEAVKCHRPIILGEPLVTRWRRPGIGSIILSFEVFNAGILSALS